MKKRIAIVDDHELISEALAGLVQKFEGFEVAGQFTNGQELLDAFKTTEVDIVLLDVQMPVMDGFETALWLKENKPEVLVLALSMFDNEESIVKMIKNGAKGYLRKGSKPSELKEALEGLINKGFYYSEFVTDKLVASLSLPPAEQIETLKFNDREKHFIELAATEMTYAEMAEVMCVSPKTIENYRESVFEKLNVKSRIGVVVEGIKLGIVKV